MSHSRETATGRIRQSGFSPETPMISRQKLGSIADHLQLRNPSFPGLSWDDQAPASCLPCRRSRVRIPSAASQKAYICRSFSSRQSPCSSASGRTDSGLAVRRSSVASRKRRFAGHSRSSELKSFCRPAEGQAFGRVRPLPDSCCNGTILRTAPAGAIPPIAALGGQSGFSPETARSTSTRSATPASHGTQSRVLLRRTASEAAARSPSRRACVAAVTRGSSRGCRFPSASRRPRAPGLGCWLSSSARVSRVCRQARSGIKGSICRCAAQTARSRNCCRPDGPPRVRSPLAHLRCCSLHA